MGGAIISAAITVHTRLGPGLLESTYRECLAHELRKKFMLKTEVYLTLDNDDLKIARAFKADLIVDAAAIIEIKHVEKLLVVHEAQLRTYLRLAEIKTGFLLNFNVVAMKNGIRRIDLL